MLRGDTGRFDDRGYGAADHIRGSHERDGRSNSKLSFWTHFGTHIDPPYHFVDGGLTIA